MGTEVAAKKAGQITEWLDGYYSPICKNLPTVKHGSFSSHYMADGDQCYGASLFITDTIIFLIVLAVSLLIAWLFLKERSFPPKNSQKIIKSAYLKHNIQKNFSILINSYLKNTLFINAYNGVVKWSLLIFVVIFIQFIGIFIQRKYGTLIIIFGFIHFVTIFIAWTIDEIEKSKNISPKAKIISVDSDLNAEMIYAICSIFILIPTLYFHVNHMHGNGEKVFTNLSGDYLNYIGFTIYRIYDSFPVISELFPIINSPYEKSSNASLYGRLVSASIDAFVNIVIVGSAIKLAKIHTEIAMRKDKRKLIARLHRKLKPEEVQEIFDDLSKNVLDARATAIQFFADIKAEIADYSQIILKNPTFLTLVKEFYQEHIDPKKEIIKVEVEKKKSLWERFKSLFE